MRFASTVYVNPAQHTTANSSINFGSTVGDQNLDILVYLPFP